MAHSDGSHSSDSSHSSHSSDSARGCHNGSSSNTDRPTDDRARAHLSHTSAHASFSVEVDRIDVSSSRDQEPRVGVATVGLEERAERERRDDLETFFLLTSLSAAASKAVGRGRPGPASDRTTSQAGWPRAGSTDTITFATGVTRGGIRGIKLKFLRRRPLALLNTYKTFIVAGGEARGGEGVKRTKVFPSHVNSPRANYHN